MEQNGHARIGVYICHCGLNIAGTVNVSEVREFISRAPGVVVAGQVKVHPFVELRLQFQALRSALVRRCGLHRRR